MTPIDPKTKPKGFGDKTEKRVRYKQSDSKPEKEVGNKQSDLKPEKKIRQYSAKELKAIKQNRQLQNDRIRNRRQKTYSFENKLKGRCEISKPNVVWGMDFTTLPIKKEGAEFERSKHYMLGIVDMFARRIIHHKVYFLSKGKGSVSAAKVLKALEQTLNERKPAEEVMIHTDNGTEFNNCKYYDFVSEHPIVVGTTSIPGHPEHNSVVERVIETLKNSLNSEDEGLKQYKLSESVTTKQQCETFMNRKVKFYNDHHKGVYNSKLAAKEKEDKFARTELVQPEIILTQKEDIVPYSKHYSEIKTFHKNLAYEDTTIKLQNKGIEQKLDKQQQILFGIGNVLSNQNESLECLHEKVDTITPKKIIKHKKQIERAPMPHSIMEEIIADPKPYKVPRICWQRFQLASLLLFYTGMRVNEVAYFTLTIIKQLMEVGETEIFQTKTSAIRKIRISSFGITALQKLKPETLSVFKDNDDLVYPPIKTAIKHKWIEFFNKKLAPYQEKYKLKLTSHSFRIHFITQTLRHSRVEFVQQIVGHQDSRSTLRYDRNKISKKKQIEVLDLAFNPDAQYEIEFSSQKQMFCTYVNM